MCTVEAQVKLNRLDTAQTELAAVTKVEQIPASFSRSHIWVADMISKAYSFFFVKSTNKFRSRKVRFII